MMVNKRSLLLGGAVTAIAALSLTACGGSNSSTPQPSETAAQSSPAAAEAGSLTVWVDANREPVLKDAAADFQAESGVKVDLVIKDFSKIQEDFLKQVPTGKGPDITIGAHDWLGNLVNNGVVQPVELGDKSADFQDVAMDAMSYEGNTYGVPYATENLALLRNKDLADKAPATFDEMIAEGEKAGTDFRSWYRYRSWATRSTPTHSRPPLTLRCSEPMKTAPTTPATCRSATRAAWSSPSGSPTRAKREP